MMDTAVRLEFNGGTNSKKIVTPRGGGGAPHAKKLSFLSLWTDLSAVKAAQGKLTR